MEIQLSILVVFFNNQREAPRTLYTLSSDYQQNIEGLQYEVLALDSNSSEPLSKEIVCAFGNEFQYHYVKTDYPSPVEALQFGLKKAKGKYVMVLIDGAHMLTPNILSLWLKALKAYDDPFVIVQRFQLGRFKQNFNLQFGYNQEKEDELLNSIDWKNNGYLLFDISNYEQAVHWWFSQQFESNCVILKKEHLIEYGSFNKPFYTVGGGFLNLDLYKNAMEDDRTQNVMLLGESTFHQFHGGTTTNVERNELKLKEYREEYRKINNAHFAVSGNYQTHYLGSIHPTNKNQVQLKKSVFFYSNIARELFDSNKIDLAMDFINYSANKFPFNINILKVKANFLKKLGKNEEAIRVVNKAIEIDPIDISLLLLNGELLYLLNKKTSAIELFKKVIQLNPGNPGTYIRISRFYHRLKEFEKSRSFAEKILSCKEKLENEHIFCNTLIYLYNRKFHDLLNEVLKSANKIDGIDYNFNYKFIELSQKKSTLSSDDMRMIFQLYKNHIGTNEIFDDFTESLLSQSDKRLIEEYCEFEEEKGRHFVASYTRAKKLAKEKRFKESAEFIDNALNQTANKSRLCKCHKIQARNYESLNLWKKAKKHNIEAQKIQPNNLSLQIFELKAITKTEDYNSLKDAYNKISLKNLNVPMKKRVYRIMINAAKNEESNSEQQYFSDLLNSISNK